MISDLLKKHPKKIKIMLTIGVFYYFSKKGWL